MPNASDARADRDPSGIRRRFEAVERWTMKGGYRSCVDRREHREWCVRRAGLFEPSTWEPAFHTGAYHPSPDSSSPCASKSSPPHEGAMRHLPRDEPRATGPGSSHFSFQADRGASASLP